tara:strand:- start:4141 stop:5718 length:1578 start_codon:yes stop_codon:yes gene_type:complete
MKVFANSVQLRTKLENGISTVAENVASTLGPKGRNVILHKKGKNPIVTKDGVTVAKFIDLEDPIENTAAQILKQAAEKTNQEAGDGTTTTTVLAYSMYKEAQRYLTAGAPPVELKKGMELAVNYLVRRIEVKASPIKSLKDIENIATIAANGDMSIGKLITKAIDVAGKDGAVQIEEARSLETSLDLVEGFRFDSGYLATAFITDETKGVVRYDNPLFLVTDEKIEAVEDMLPALEVAAREGRPFIIVAENVEGQALAALIMNAMRGTMRVAAIKAPRYGEERRNILRDLALSTGAAFVSRENGIHLREINLTHFGEAKTIEAGKRSTIIMGGKGKLEDVEKQIEKIKAIIKDTDSLTECERLQERITRLSSGISVIRIGAATEIELIEKKHRIEDALEAVKAAQIEGILPGGGIFLPQQTKNLLEGIAADIKNEWHEMGVKIVMNAVQEPLKQMALNSGNSPDIILDKVINEKDGRGYNFKKDKVANMLKEGITDSARVMRCALQNSLSVATVLIMSNYAIVEE